MEKKQQEFATVHKCPNDRIKNVDGTFEVTKFDYVKCLTCSTTWKVIKHGIHEEHMEKLKNGNN